MRVSQDLAGVVRKGFARALIFRGLSPPCFASRRLVRRVNLVRLVLRRRTTSPVWIAAGKKAIAKPEEEPGRFDRFQTVPPRLDFVLVNLLRWLHSDTAVPTA
jgi:hypothetical protein